MFFTLSPTVVADVLPGSECQDLRSKVKEMWDHVVFGNEEIPVASLLPAEWWMRMQPARNNEMMLDMEFRGRNGAVVLSGRELIHQLQIFSGDNGLIMWAVAYWAKIYPIQMKDLLQAKAGLEK